MRTEPVAWLAGTALFTALALAAPFIGDYHASLLALVFLFAFFGQAWNLMMGFAGQLSLGHALFVGIGGYTMGVLSTRYGVTPWLGLPAGAALSALAGAAIGWLGFRFALRGVHFALLTIAFAEFARVVFSSWNLVGGSAGLFLPAVVPGANPLATLRGDAAFFYLFTLLLAAAGTGFTAWLRRSSLGYVWRAMRDDEDAARALGVRAFRHKLLATAISGGMTGLGGGVYGLLNGALFPDSMMGMNLSIEIIVGPILGGLATAFGPLVGALFAVPLAHATSEIGASLGIFGLNTLAYGLALVLVVWVLPGGIWPALARLGRLRRAVPAPGPAALEARE